MVAFTADPRGGERHSGVGLPGLTPLTISPRQRLDEVTGAMAALPMGATDCALPILRATVRRLRTDLFMILTDSETWAGPVHPAEALREYRRTINPFSEDARRRRLRHRDAAADRRRPTGKTLTHEGATVPRPRAFQ